METKKQESFVSRVRIPHGGSARAYIQLKSIPNGGTSRLNGFRKVPSLCWVVIYLLRLGFFFERNCLDSSPVETYPSVETPLFGNRSS